MGTHPITDIDAQIIAALRRGDDPMKICRTFRIVKWDRVTGRRRMDLYGIQLTEKNPKLLQLIWNTLDLHTAQWAAIS